MPMSLFLQCYDVDQQGQSLHDVTKSTSPQGLILKRGCVLAGDLQSSKLT